jgi:hypothetical protein
VAWMKCAADDNAAPADQNSFKKGQLSVVATRRPRDFPARSPHPVDSV